GLIDAVAIYNRALSAAEVRDSYTSGGPGKCPFFITPLLLRDGDAGVSYAQTLSVHAGTAPVTYALAAGALPVGLSLSSLGEIGGIPTAAGAFDFTVEATDATGHTALRAYTIDIPTCVP